MFRKLTGPGLLRLLLAELVFVHHLSRFAFGKTAVYVFFSLSGFWIYQMYTRRYSKARSPYLTYLISRIWRLLPTFLLMSLLAIVFISLNGKLPNALQKDGAAHLVLSSLFIFGYNLLPYQPIVPAWSLDIEMQFYLVAPFFALALQRLRGRRAGLLVAGTALVSGLALVFWGEQFVFSYLIFFVIGMAAASIQWKPSGRQAFSFLAIMVLAVTLCLCSPWRGILVLGAHPGPLVGYNPAANIILAFLIFPYAIYTTRQKGFSADGMFGDLSYVTYLLHWIGVLWLARYVTAGTLQRAANIALMWVTVTVISWVIWKFYDHPINRLRSNWVSAQLKPAESQRPSVETTVTEVSS
jgi:peptidoglycan/LPS O-acetylase OafA/YrhL